jgi:hypothetical protein
MTASERPGCGKNTRGLNYQIRATQSKIIFSASDLNYCVFDHAIGSATTHLEFTADSEETAYG